MNAYGERENKLSHELKPVPGSAGGIETSYL